MKKEQVLDLMNAVPADLVEEADVERPAKRRLPGMVRTGLIAACLCLALVGTAFAAVRYFWVEVFSNEEQTGYRVHGKLIKYPVDRFSAELLADCETSDNANLAAGFHTWEEAKAYLGGGIPLLWPKHVLPDDIHDPPIYLFLGKDHGNGDKLCAVWVVCRAKYIDRETGRQIEPLIDMYIATEYNPDGKIDPALEGSVGGTLYGNQGFSLEQLEDYLMPNGTTAGIVLVEYPQTDDFYPRYECTASFIQGGILYYVDSGDSHSASRPEDALADLKTILDLFP